MCSLIFRPSKFPGISLDEDIPQATEEKLQEYLPEVQRRIRAVRASYGIALLLMTITIALGWGSGAALASSWPNPSAIIPVLQAFAGGILLAATLGRVGWNIQTYNGQTLAEKSNRWLFRSLYVLGTYQFVLATAWAWFADSDALDRNGVPIRSPVTTPSWAWVASVAGSYWLPVLIIVGFVHSFFYGAFALKIWKGEWEKETLAQRVHQRWLNFGGAAAGWAALIFLVAKLQSTEMTNVKYIDVVIFLIAVLGVVGFLPRTLSGLVESVQSVLAAIVKRSVG